MELSSDLIREFAKNTKDEPTINQGATVYGTFRVQDDINYVQIDGSDTRTPVASTITAKNGDRVTVLIKDHSAIVTGNLEDPSASSEEVEEVKKTMGQSTLDIEDLKQQLANQEITLDEYREAIADAKRMATDYIDFSAGTGLVIGSTSISSNVRIYSGGIDIRDGNTILASYTDDTIYLGKENSSATIDLCNGSGTIDNSYDSYASVNALVLKSANNIVVQASNGGYALLRGTTSGIIVNDSANTVHIQSTASGGQMLLASGGVTIGSGSTSTSAPYIRMNYGTNIGTLNGSWNISGYAESGHYHSSLGYYPTVTLISTSFRPDSDGIYLGGSAHRWAMLYADTACNTSSDIRLKTDLSTDFNKYVQMLDLIEPTSYRLIKDEEGRRHVGYIAQRVWKAMQDVGISKNDFAGFTQDMQEEGTVYTYGLAYEEFIPILHAKIKQLEQRINDLEGKEVA